MRRYRINFDGEKLSRKAKLALYGRRKNASKIFQRYQKLNIHRHPKNIFEWYEFSGSDALFCPRCGHDDCESSGNMVQDPELWDICSCSHCGLRVCVADNSPYIHILALAKEEESENGRFSKRGFEAFINDGNIW